MTIGTMIIAMLCFGLGMAAGAWGQATATEWERKLRSKDEGEEARPESVLHMDDFE